MSQDTARWKSTFAVRGRLKSTAPTETAAATAAAAARRKRRAPPISPASMGVVRR
uniref:Uncharacterized protein n=1 Tax=Arundo donax TaxID=35708 RepID=A0A0A8XST0_ARUDO